MSKINDGGAAFPCQSQLEFIGDGSLRNRADYEPQQTGMSLRDWFAGQANAEAFVAGVLDRHYDYHEQWVALNGPMFIPGTTWERMSLSERFVAAVVYHKRAIADAMLAQREEAGK